VDLRLVGLQPEVDRIGQGREDVPAGSVPTGRRGELLVDCGGSRNLFFGFPKKRYRLVVVLAERGDLAAPLEELARQQEQLVADLSNLSLADARLKSG